MAKNIALVLEILQQKDISKPQILTNGKIDLEFY